jgi:hypothetical protein
VRVVCPKCGSDRIRSVDTVICTNEVVQWVRGEDGKPKPNNYDNGETWWDSCEPHPTHPYDCADCSAEFKSLDELKVVEEKEQEA